MRFRKLRIAWSVFWGVAAVLLIVLWVRSYSYMDTAICYRGGYWYEIQSLPVGRLQVKFMESSGIRDGWFFRSGEHVDERSRRPLVGWKGRYHNAFFAYCAHWIAALLAAALAATPWIRHFKWRFSLRTLLIATTLVAVVLGLIVYATR